MNSDRIKKIILNLSVVLAMIIFICLYMINLRNENENDKDVKSQDSVKSTSANSPMFKENKNIYNSYKFDEFFDVYINVFATKAEDGRTYDFSDFDLIADWNDKLNPKLNASVRFVNRGKKAKQQAIGSANATIRVRGNPGSALKSYRIKFMDGTEGIKGQSTFNLDKNLNDTSRIANKLAHDLIIDLKHISGFRTSFLEVFIRDDELKEKADFYTYGLYTHIEQPNKAYLKSHGLDENGSIYRAEDFYFKLTPQLKDVDDPDYDEKAFETVLAIREGKDHSKLLRMLKDLNDDSKDFDKVFHTYFDEDNYLTWLSINILLGNVEAMSEGFLMYNPSSSSVFYLLPWDFDGIFNWMNDDDDAPSIYDGLNNVVLHKKYLQKTENIDKLRKRIEEIKNNEFSPEKVKLLIKTYKPVILEMMDKYPDNILSSIELNKLVAYLGQIDERILINYNTFMERYGLN